MMNKNLTAIVSFSHDNHGFQKQWFYQRFLEIFIYPSLWVAAGIASLVYFTQDTLNLPVDWHSIALIFAAALVPYNLDRILDSFVQRIPDPKAQAYFRQPGIFFFLITAILAIAILLYSAPLKVRLVSCGGLIPLLYGIPLLPLRQQQKTRWYRLKDIPGAKAWIVAGIITYAVVAVPLAYADAVFDRSAALTTLFLLVFVGTNSHLFDVRDVNSDLEKGVLTLPLMIGVRGIKIFWTILNLVLSIVLSWSKSTGLAIPEPAIFVPVIVVNLMAIWLLNPNSPRNAYSIWLDGCLFLPGLLTWLISSQ